MEILYYTSNDKSIMSTWQYFHIFDELKRHDCTVRVFNALEYNDLYHCNESLLDDIKKSKPDLFMTVFSEKELFLATLSQIKKMGIPTLLICFDNLTIPFVHLKIAPLFDLVWLTSKETKWMFDKVGCKSIFLPYAANPYIKPGKEKVLGVGFVGTPYGSRANVFNAFTNCKIDTYCHCIKQNNDNTVILRKSKKK